MSLRPSLRAVLAAALCLLATSSFAQEFAAVISPPRFEDRVAPGKTYRNVFEMTNVSSRPARFTVETADWALDGSGSPVFSQPLAPGSCRPWVAIEANELRIAPGAKRRFRFEVSVPADAPRGECRFAIMVEGEPGVPQGGVPLPVSGRIGVIVYLAIGEAAPALEVLRVDSIDLNGTRVPALTVRNTGDMHGRLDGWLAAVDGAGQRLVLVPDNSPVLPGMTRTLPLLPQAEGRTDVPPAITWPLRLKGRLDAERQRVEVDATVER